MTEKRKPTYDLDAVKAALRSVERLRVTGTAVRTATTLGFDRAGIVVTIQAMQRRQFHKSITACADHRIWQDVYHVPSRVGTLYVKFTPWAALGKADTVSEFLLLSFKEKDNG